MSESVQEHLRELALYVSPVAPQSHSVMVIREYIADLEEKLQERSAQLFESEADINTERANTERAKKAYNSLLADHERLKASRDGVEPKQPDGGRIEQLQADLSDALRGGPYQVVAALIVEIAREANKEER